MNPESNCIILHGCPPSSDNIISHENRWMNWLADQLVAKGFDAVAPDMPEPWEAKYTKWKAEFINFPVTEDTILVGHSCGAAFLVRWLLETGLKVKKLILVAPAMVPEGTDDARRDLYDFELPEDGNKIADEIIIFSSNDLPHHLKSLELYKKALKPKVVKLENKVHFLYFQMGTEKFPELLDEVLKFVK